MVSCCASAGSKAAQGSSATHSSQQSQKRGAAPLPPSPPTPSPPPPWVREGGGHFDISGFVWDHHLSLAKIASFHVGCGLSLFLSAWGWITSDQIVFEVVR